MANAYASGLLGAVSPAEVEELLFRLVQTPSHQDAPGCENGVVELLRGWLAERGINAEAPCVVDGRRNLIARLEGDGIGRSLLLNAHSDTIPPGAMKDPFLPRVDGDRIWGRGSVDTKASIAAMAGALVALKRSGIRLRGDLVLAVTIGEESYSPGADHLVKSGVRVDYAIVGEPTDMRPGVAHKGLMRLEATFVGRPAHGSVPEKGINAIYKACRWVERVRTAYIPALEKRVHPLLGRPVMNVGVIEGGMRPSVVPAQCTVKFERRLLPGEREEDVLKEFQDLTAELVQSDPDMNARVAVMPDFRGVPHGAFEASADSPLVRELCAAYGAEFGVGTTPTGLQYWTDAALLASIPGAQVVVCGPGNIEQAHSDAEYVSRRQLRAAHSIYTRVAHALCCGGS